jgi:hypothetical protein
VERYADSLATIDEIDGELAFADWDRTSGYGDAVYAYAQEATELLTHEDGFEAAACVSGQAAAAVNAAANVARANEKGAPCKLLRDIIGNPFRPVADARRSPVGPDDVR